MKHGKGEPRLHHLDELQLQRDIARFERMSEAELNEYLKKHNVDAETTVASVLEIVRSRSGPWQWRSHAVKK